MTSQLALTQVLGDVEGAIKKRGFPLQILHSKWIAFGCIWTHLVRLGICIKMQSCGPCGLKTMMRLPSGLSLAKFSTIHETGNL